MTDLQIISLLQRYMDGLTTIDEEKALAEFFSKATDDNRPEAISADDWRAYREMFGMFATANEPIEQSKEEISAITHGFNLRNVAVWITSAAAVALLVFAVSTQLDNNTMDNQPLAQQVVNKISVDSIADSISAERPQPIAVDSIKPQPVKQQRHKTVRPYWQPRPPKVYVADVLDAKPDTTDIEEAVRQADILLQAISVHQSAEINQLELQALEVFEDDDSDNDMAQ
ncbi:hypothetical protein [Prevotella sp.]|uniref:hypothetical protein n=1 Tax=Prevotella sp. TaxID=59823 RepID=UPI002E790BE8|nr:hypothetical protein [Prevotella sp.]MEE0669929.1 hypothetical protein [Prevotella sp.]